MEYEVRQIPKKFIIMMIIVVLLGITVYFIVATSKESKVTKILAHVGYDKVTQVTVFAEHPFLNEETNVKGKRYSIKFRDLKTDKICKGFVLADFKRNYSKDIECK